MFFSRIFKHLLVFTRCLCALLLLNSATAIASGVLVVAPHPDDDILLASGVVHNALKRGDDVKIVYMTNGDAGGLDIAATRQGEAVSAQRDHLGMVESDLIFLGYPSSELKVLFDTFSDPSSVLVTSNNGQSQTYASRGLGGTDYHTYKFGNPANYNKPNVVIDVKDILLTYRPDHIYITAEEDQHSDHGTTYSFFKVALLELAIEDPTYVPVVHKSIVWSSISTQWPDGINPRGYHAGPIPGNPFVWEDRESVEVPVAMQDTDIDNNLKVLAVRSHNTQLGLEDFLLQFIHKDEIFWSENLTNSNMPPRADAGYDQIVVGEGNVILNGAASIDPDDGSTLYYQWVQLSGTPVVLSGSTTSNPSFTAPGVIAQDEILEFELTVSDGQISSAPSGVKITVSTQQATNIARVASVIASSGNTTSMQYPVRAVDGDPRGYPSNATAEWATEGEGAGAWIELTWESPYLIDRVILYDRPNSYAQILSGTLIFSDGTSVSVGALDNAGTSTNVLFSPRVVSSVRFVIDTVSATTGSTGLSEIEVIGVPSFGGNIPPSANAGANQIVTEGSIVTLDGVLSNDPEGSLLIYQWVQTAGTPVFLSNLTSTTPDFTAPTGLSSNEVLTFELVVNDGIDSSSPDSVNITVSAQIISNIALTSNVLASSENTSADQLAVKAVDGGIDGWPGDYTREWATNGEGAGAWIELSWGNPHLVDRVVLYDRPNLNAHILSGTLVFGDGTSVFVGPLDNSGLATEIRFPSRVVNNIRFVIDQVSAGTGNTGLAEIEVFGALAVGANSPPVADAGSDQIVLEGALVLLDGLLSSDPEGSSLTYYWTQTAGSIVTLSDPASSQPTFIAPVGLAADEVLSFQVIVDDGTLSSVSDVMDVSVLASTPANIEPSANAGADQYVPEGSLVQLDGSLSSDPEGSLLSYSWVQITGPSVGLDDNSALTPSFVAPAGLLIDTLLTFGLVVNDGDLNSLENLVNVIVSPQIESNIALISYVMASSQNSATNQQAIKAVDGVVDGYPNDYTAEWATQGEGAGAWIELSWVNAYVVDRIVLYDRPNPYAELLSGTLVFSDGTTVPVGPLDNSGSAIEVTFSPRSITSVRLVIDSVSSTTGNAGLAEFEVFGVLGL